ncbi:MAG TPA: ECF transporter S component [Candidatus Olsenella stercoravium]|uniref:ECF transporter S component n=1 Tax=Candidatus Olsenella stercoravium TaxID=2838713 RepID=A0A9D2IPU0_9ACTN|nr:ECF transporter S component [Candidatus Olsenella stercoravium]
MSQVKRIVIAAVCAALCIVLPMAFHSIPNAGALWLPMHIPVMVSGLVAGPVAGAVTGLLGPVLSSLLTGMPAAPILPSMTCELVVYGLVSGLLCAHVRTGRLPLDLYVSLVGAMICGRIVGGLLQALIFSAGSYSLAAWATAYFLTGLPGIVLQLVVVVPVVVALERAGLVPARYGTDR